MVSKKVFGGKVALICGGSKGMGKAIASDFVRMGGNVYIIARNMEDLKKAQEEVRRLSLKIYKFGRDLAARKGIIVADTKFEFGIKDGKLILIDEVLTPDSSRFWPMDTYAPGGPQKSFDKQFLRDYLVRIKWPKTPPPPKLPEEIIAKTREKYLDALERLTGRGL